MQLDHELLKACVKDDRRAQKKVYEWCYTHLIKQCVRYYSNHEDARMVFNMAFLKIVKGLEQVDWNELHFLPWAKRIVANAIIDDFRKNKNHKQYLTLKENDAELSYFAGASPNDGETEMGVQSVMKLLEQIPSTSAHVFSLYVIDGFSHKEIGELLGMTEGTSKWHLSTARKQLRDLLEQLEKEPLKRMAI